MAVVELERGTRIVRGDVDRLDRLRHGLDLRADRGDRRDLVADDAPEHAVLQHQRARFRRGVGELDDPRVESPPVDAEAHLGDVHAGGPQRGLQLGAHARQGRPVETSRGTRQRHLGDLRRDQHRVLRQLHVGGEGRLDRRVEPLRRGSGDERLGHRGRRALTAGEPPYVRDQSRPACIEPLQRVPLEDVGEPRLVDHDAVRCLGDAPLAVLVPGQGERDARIPGGAAVRPGVVHARDQLEQHLHLGLVGVLDLVVGDVRGQGPRLRSGVDGDARRWAPAPLQRRRQELARRGPVVRGRDARLEEALHDLLRPRTRDRSGGDGEDVDVVRRLPELEADRHVSARRQPRAGRQQQGHDRHGSGAEEAT